MRLGNRQEYDFERNKGMKRLMMLAAVVVAAMPLMTDTEMVGGYTWTDGIDGGKAANVV